MTSPQAGMTAQQYAAAQAVITEQLASNVAALAELFRAPRLRAVDWEHLLNLLFPFVEEARTQSARLARRFFDGQNALHRPGEAPPPVLLARYERPWFAEEMYPARKEFLKPGAADHAVSMVVLRAMKAVNNGGRRTLIQGIEDAPEVVTGWARVATGKETCAFCLMLVSRGPVYSSARDAGLDLDDEDASELFGKAEGDIRFDPAMAGLMTRWHPGCDCLVMPVFDIKNWPGRQAAHRAYGIWKKTTRGFSGKDAMNAFRRAIERGDVDVSAFAFTV